MNIIIDPDQIESYRKKYTVLELDTIRILPEDRKVTAYCVVENISLGELFSLEHNKTVHETLMESYKKKDWNMCNRAIDELTGSWSGELDSFYTDLKGRVAKYIEQDPGETWDGIIEKHTA
jgi:hypothetical protein